MYSKKCDTCGNEYDNPIRVEMEGKSYYFDCFECAIHRLAPACSHCSVRVIGHGVETEQSLFCSAHCAREAGRVGVHDRYPESLAI